MALRICQKEGQKIILVSLFWMIHFFFFFPPRPTGLELLLLLDPNNGLARKGQRVQPWKAAAHQHRVCRASIQVHEARRRVFSRKGAKKTGKSGENSPRRYLAALRTPRKL